MATCRKTGSSPLAPYGGDVWPVFSDPQTVWRHLMSDPPPDKTLRGLKQLLAPRQAVAVHDPATPVALKCRWPTNRTVWARGSHAGLYAVGYGSGGGLYLSRTLPVGTVQRLARRAEEVTIVRGWDELDDALKRGPGTGYDG